MIRTSAMDELLHLLPRLVGVLILAVFCAPALAGTRLGIKGFERATFWYIHPDTTDGDIARHVEAFVRSGVNGVIVGGGRHHYLHDDLPYLDQHIDVLKRVVAACHARGIRVCEHHSVVLTTRKDYAQEHAGWIQRDFETGDFSVWPEYQTYAFCPNNPEFREHYWKILADIVRRTGVDAVMSDDASFHHGCACRACSERWRKEVGGDLREAQRLARTPGTPQWRRFNSVRQGWYTDFRLWLYGRMRNEMPTVQCFSLLGSLLSPWGPQTSGANQEGMLTTGDASWWEIYNPADFYSWRRIAAESAALHEAGRTRRSDVATLPYADRAAQRDVADPEEETFMWAMSMAHGLRFTQARVFLTGIIPDEPARAYWAFEKATLDRYAGAESAATVGIFFSRRSRDADPRWEAMHTAPAIGWAESLQDAGIPYRGIVEDTLDAGVPKGIRALIVPNVFALSDAHLNALEAFARAGGALIMTHRTGFDDADGAPAGERRKARLELLCGLSFGANDPEAEPPRVTFSAARARRREGPLEAFENRVGGGRVVTLPGLPGRRVFQDQVNEGDPYTDPRDPRIARALADLVASLIPVPPVRVQSARQDAPVLATAWRRKGALLIHVVNVAGARLEEGAKVPAPSRVVWAPGRDITFTFAKPPKRLRVFSLDPSENRTLERPGARVTLSSPRRYALIVAEP